MNRRQWLSGCVAGVLRGPGSLSRLAVCNCRPNKCFKWKIKARLCPAKTTHCIKGEHYLESVGGVSGWGSQWMYPQGFRSGLKWLKRDLCRHWVNSGGKTRDVIFRYYTTRDREAWTSPKMYTGVWNQVVRSGEHYIVLREVSLCVCVCVCEGAYYLSW